MRRRRVMRLTLSLTRRGSILSEGVALAMTMSARRKKKIPPPITIPTLPIHLSAVDETHVLQRPSSAAASGTYPSSHTAQSGPAACSAHLIRVSLNTVHALGFRHANTGVSPRSKVWAVGLRRRRFTIPVGGEASYHHPSRSFSTPPEQSIPRGPQLKHDVPPRAAYSPIGHGAQADCAESGTEPAEHTEQRSDPEAAILPNVHGLHSYAFAFSHLCVPTAHAEQAMKAASRTAPASQCWHSEAV